MLEKIQTYYESSTKGKIIVLVSILVPFLLFTYFVYTQKKAAENENSSLVIENDKLIIVNEDNSFGYTKSDYYESKRKKNKIEPTDDFFKYSSDIIDTKNDFIEDEYEDIYNEENDSIVKALQRQAIANAAKDVKPVQSKPKPKKESEDEYKARLRRELEEYYANRREKRKAKNKIKDEKEKFVKISAAFHMDQWLVPGQRLNLFLTRDFSHNGMLFKKGTILYAFISVVEHRIFLDMKKISDQDFDIEVLDFKDDLPGIYDRTGRAKNLWDKYKKENIDNSTEEIEDIIEQSTKSRFFAKTVQSVTNFFKTSKIKQKERLYFMNDKEVILKIKI